MSLSHFHMNDKQIKQANAQALSAAIDTVCQRYDGEKEHTADVILKLEPLIQEAQSIQTGATRFNWEGKRADAIKEIILLLSSGKLKLLHVLNASGVRLNTTRLVSLLRSIEAHTQVGRKNIARNVSGSNPQMLGYNMEALGYLGYLSKMEKEYNLKVFLARNKVALDFADEFEELHIKINQGKASALDIKRYVTLSHAINEEDALSFEVLPTKEAC